MALTSHPVDRAVNAGLTLLTLTPHPGVSQTWAVHVLGRYVGLVAHRTQADGGPGWRHTRGGSTGPDVGTRDEAIVTLLTSGRTAS